MSQTQKLSGVIWDLDGTKYTFLDGFYDACDMAVVKAAQQLWPQYVNDNQPIPSDEALFQMAKQSYADNHLSYAFLTHAHGIPEDVAHMTYHDHAPLHLVGTTPGLREAFSRLNSLEHIIYTHASKPWAEAVLAREGFAAHYDDSRIVAAETVGFARKHKVRDGFDHCANVLGLPHNQLAMVDDTPDCLRIPKELGMTTILLDHGRDLPAFDHVDYKVQNGTEAANLLFTLSR